MKNRVFFLIVPALLLGLYVSGQTGNWVDYANTDWYTNNPDKKEFIIATAEEFSGLSKLVNEGHSFKDITFVLAGDMDLNAHHWEQIGSDEENPFCGVLDGKGFKIKNMFVGKQNKYLGTGLFGYVGDGAKIQNLSLEGGKILGFNNESTRDYISHTGALTGVIKGVSDVDSVVIRNCHNLNVPVVSGLDYTKEHDGMNTGGLIGFASGKVIIDACSNNASISIPGEKNTAGVRVGGLIGFISGSFTITHCRNTGDISSPYLSPSYIGGLIGTAETGNINTCQISTSYSEGAITVKDGLYGGICGGFLGGLNDYSYSNTEGGLFILEDCFSNIAFDTRSIYTQFFVGNIDRSYLGKVVVKDCYATGKILNCITYSSPDFMSASDKEISQTSIEVNNCLYIIDHINEGFLPNNKIIRYPENASHLTLENNYVFVNGQPVNPDEKAGADWSGYMNQAPVSVWNKSKWQIDESHKILPYLKGFTDFPQINNPLYNQPAGYYSVFIPEYTGINIDQKGTFKIKQNKSFVFSMTPKDYQKVTVKTQDGIDIPVDATIDPYSIYIIENITKDIEVFIEGKGIQYIPDGEWSENADMDWFTKDKKIYTLSNENEFAGFAKLVNGGHSFADTTFMLANDLNLRPHYWEPIAKKEDNSFQGVFNGNNKTIRSLYTTEELCTGLFGYVGSGAQILNLTLKNGKVIGLNSDDKTLFTGSLVGAAKTSDLDSAVIRNCHNQDVLVVGGATYQRLYRESTYTGGLIGSASGKVVIDKCTNAGKITNKVYDLYNGDFCIGGIIGYITGNSSISYCANYGEINTNGSGTSGGICSEVYIRENNSMQIVSCYNNSDTYGGIVGSINNNDLYSGEGEFLLKNCYSLSKNTKLIGVIDARTKSIRIENNSVILTTNSFWDKKAALINTVKNRSENTSFDILNNLVVIMGDYLSPRLINNAEGLVRLTNNYAYAEINRELEDENTELNGIDWSGKMDEGPVDKWDEQYWTIDKTNKEMPLLKGIPNQTAIPNPVYDVSDQYKVIFPEVEGISMNYLPGTYHIKEGKDFVFYIIDWLPGTDISKMTVETDEGVLIPKVDGYYRLSNINKDTRIIIKNVETSVKEVLPGSKVWSASNNLYIEVEQPQMLLVYHFSGQLYKQQNISDGRTVVSVPTGIYIVRIGKETHKVIVR